MRVAPGEAEGEGLEMRGDQMTVGVRGEKSMESLYTCCLGKTMF